MKKSKQPPLELQSRVTVTDTRLSSALLFIRSTRACEKSLRSASGAAPSAVPPLVRQRPRGLETQWLDGFQTSPRGRRRRGLRQEEARGRRELPDAVDRPRDVEESVFPVLCRTWGSAAVLPQC
ncbi:hypothetical protein Y032_0239g3304 [Ancylostoma ceylanicum]|uniref:Uncharacterized protein n=1 Tax=Ancylostoma ceylanicum TaxID=53326 RepID=A0A016SEU0_9BILA|nr:hypothetical protein Y032_0239g3304 [Ancylostoma ceylanicum]